jgi:hypothetical protein
MPMASKLHFGLFNPYFMEECKLGLHFYLSLSENA